jgi:hypothetical protein
MYILRQCRKHGANSKKENLPKKRKLLVKKYELWRSVNREKL